MGPGHRPIHDQRVGGALVPPRLASKKGDSERAHVGGITSGAPRAEVVFGERDVARGVAVDLNARTRSDSVRGRGVEFDIHHVRVADVLPERVAGRTGRVKDHGADGGPVGERPGVAHPHVAAVGGVAFRERAEAELHRLVLLRIPAVGKVGGCDRARGGRRPIGAVGRGVALGPALAPVSVERRAVDIPVEIGRAGRTRHRQEQCLRDDESA